VVEEPEQLAVVPFEQIRKRLGVTVANVTHQLVVRLCRHLHLRILLIRQEVTEN
jgi:hypothetical protein